MIAYDYRRINRALQSIGIPTHPQCTRVLCDLCGYSLLLPLPPPVSCRCSRSLGFIYQCQATTLMHKCIHFKLIFILIPILPNMTRLTMTSWLNEKCEMVGRQFGSIVDCNLSFNNRSYISYILMSHQNNK